MSLALDYHHTSNKNAAADSLLPSAMEDAMTRILVIEDEINLCENVVDILEMEGFEILYAYDGGEGIDLALTHLPDLILCDIMMPVTDGYQVLMALRENPATALIPFVFLTAKADRPSIRHGMELGADDYLTKPFAAQDLVRAVTTRIEKHQAMIHHYGQALEDLRGHIFTILPHELRTPLVSILGYAHLLVCDADILTTERIRDVATHILTAGERLHSLIENFLVCAQIEIVKHDPDRQSRMRSQYMSRPDKLTAQIAHDKARAINRETDLQIATVEVPQVRISLESLQKVIGELVDNAFKFSDAGTPVEIGAEAVNRMYQWTIRDHGRGFTPDQIATIGAGMHFERALYKSQGSELGFSIAKQLVELHAGTLDIESKPGLQTTVRVALPLG